MYVLSGEENTLQWSNIEASAMISSISFIGISNVVETLPIFHIKVNLFVMRSTLLLGEAVISAIPAVSVSLF